jgi:hypothetical protein
MPEDSSNRKLAIKVSLPENCADPTKELELLNVPEFEKILEEVI